LTNFNKIIRRTGVPRFHEDRLACLFQTISDHYLAKNYSLNTN